MNNINVKISSVKLILLAVATLLTCFVSRAQSVGTEQEIRYNPITTAVPFLTITPDSRQGAMGDAGAATSADAKSARLIAPDSISPRPTPMSWLSM